MMFFQIRPLNAAITIFVFQSALCSYEVPLDSEPWSPKRNYRPLDYMIDITNRLGVNVLYEHNFLNDNNIAFSPYGLTGILVALYEGVEGYSALQIRDTMQIPGDRNVLRVGFRDIHRKLRSYFIPEEGFLAGLSFNNENITFRQNYLDILRYYGYDFEMPTPRPTYSQSPPVSQMSVTTSAPLTAPFQTTTPSVPLNAQPEISTTRRNTETTTTREENFQTTSRVPQKVDDRFSGSEENNDTMPAVTTTKPVEITTIRQETTNTIPITTQTTTSVLLTTQTTTPVLSTMQTTTTPVSSSTQTTTPMTTPVSPTTQATTLAPSTTQSTTSVPATTQTTPIPPTTTVQSTTPTLETRFSDESDKPTETTAVPLTTQQISSTELTTSTVPIITESGEVKTTETTSSVPLTTQTVESTSQSTIPTTSEISSITQSTEATPLTTMQTNEGSTTEGGTTDGFSNPTPQSETTEISDMSTQSQSDVATLLITTPSLTAETIQSDSTILIGNSNEESSLELKEDTTTESVQTTTTGSQITSSEVLNLADNNSAGNITDDGEPASKSREIRSTEDRASMMSTFDNTLTPHFPTTVPTTLYTKLSDVSSSTIRTIETTSRLGSINDSSNDIDDGEDSEISETERTESNESENNSTERLARSIDQLKINLKINQTANAVGDLTTLENSTKGMALMSEMFSTVEYTDTPVLTIDGMSQEDDQVLTTEGSTINTFIETTEDYKITIQVKNTEKQMSIIRTKRSLQKLKVFAPFFLDHLGFYRPVYRSPSYNDGGGMQYQNSFMANGHNKVQITYMTYDTILEFAYISYLKSMAVKLPLDTSDYYLLVILPDYKYGINDLIRDMRSRHAPSLRDINNMFSDTHVRAWVPAFMLKGLIVLTTDLQKLGICDVFEPRQEDFKPMTDQRNIYARNIEQAITVTIRKYMEPSVVKRNEPWRRRDKYLYDTSGYAYNRPPVEFAATHPFLFFVMDSSLHVALMAGKIMNPLNSRIL